MTLDALPLSASRKPLLRKSLIRNVVLRTRIAQCRNMTSLSDALHQLRREMMNRYFDDGWSVGAVSKAFRRSHALVMKYVRAEKGRGRRRSKVKGTDDPRRRENRRPVSSLHCRVGVLVALHRSRKRQTMTEFGLKVGPSHIRVAELESGSYDLTVGELQVVANEIGISLLEIVRVGPSAWRIGRV